MADIVLSSINAKFIHPSLGLRYLQANLDELKERSTLLEFNLEHRPEDVIERILQETPKLVGFGVYIWNLRKTAEVVHGMRLLRPEIKIILGGPELSHGFSEIHAPLVEAADHVIQGEADLAFFRLCRELLTGASHQPKVIPASPPELRQVKAPYSLYSDADLKNRLTYVEVSRGCPFACDFCLSSLDPKVRSFEIAPFFEELQALLDRGARKFKFVDRTFNLSSRLWRPILEFFLQHIDLRPFLHFEIVPDRMPPELIELATRFPQGTLQFEVGIQTFNPEVAARIHREQDFSRTESTLRELRTRTQVHIHADLIAGLPGEHVESFASGFNHLLKLSPHEIQLGILKRLPGAPISAHDATFSMRYSAEPPYEILQTADLDFVTLQRIKRMARFWERFYNSGQFPRTLANHLFGDSAFFRFLAFSDWLYLQYGSTHSLSIESRCEYLYRYLTGPLRLPASAVLEDLLADYHAVPGRKNPRFFVELRRAGAKKPNAPESLSCSERNAPPLTPRAGK